MEHPENKGGYVVICEPDHETVMRDLIGPPFIGDGVVNMLKGEIGTVHSDYRFVASIMPRGSPKEKAQWKRERKGRP